MYTKLKNKIVVSDTSDFNVKQIFDCGQIFRYYISDNMSCVVSKDKFSLIEDKGYNIEIHTQNVEYFENFFDFKTDYSSIKNQLKKDKFLRPCCEFGYGIRILKQDLYEMIVSFIISANNNIKRIKNSLNFLAKRFGTKTTLDKEFVKKIEDSISSFTQNNSLIEIENGEMFYYAFPELEQLKMAKIEDYLEAGLGYRAKQMYDTIQNLDEKDLNNFYSLNFEEQMKFLLSLKGVGEKVANCVMLFAGASTRMFPVDTWINKVYNHLTDTNNKSRKEINKELIDKYQDLSGYAQQYFFYYYRENKLA